MRYVLLVSLTFFLNACANYDFVPTPVPELISKVIYNKTSASGSDVWQLDNDTLNIHFMKFSKDGQLITQHLKKATPNEFNIIATGLEVANFQQATSEQGAGSIHTTETLVVETIEGNRIFTQDDKTHFPKGISIVARTIPKLF